jgi:hypothetical protein
VLVTLSPAVVEEFALLAVLVIGITLIGIIVVEHAVGFEHMMMI